MSEPDPYVDVEKGGNRTFAASGAKVRLAEEADLNSFTLLPKLSLITSLSMIAFTPTLDLTPVSSDGAIIVLRTRSYSHCIAKIGQ